MTGGRGARLGARRVPALLLLPLLGLMAWALEPVLPIESGLGLRWLFEWRGPRPAPPGVVVVAIDERSAEALGLPERPRQWPRRLHADLVRQLHAAGAALVAFDLTFESETPDDAAFARSLREAGNVLLTSSLRTDVWRDGHTEAVVEQVRPAVASIGNSALDQAPFVLPKDDRIDAYWTFRRGADHMPSLPVLAFHLLRPEAFDALAAISCELMPAAGCGVPLLADALPSTFVTAPPIAPPSESIRRLRERFVDHPDHARAVADRLRQTPDVQLPAPRAQMAALLRLHAAGDLALLDFHGPARSIRTVSYADVAGAIAGEPALFRDAVVFVGYSAQSAGAQDRLRDDYRTVYSDASGVDVSGVEIAATAFANLRSDRTLQSLPPPAGAALVLLWGTWLAVLATWRRPRWPAVLMAVSAVVMLVASGLAFSRGGWWLPWVVPLLIQWPAAIGLALWHAGRHSRRQRDRLHHAFSHFVPRGVAEQLARSADALASANRVGFGVCMATDVEQYTARAEALSAGALGEQLNAYYARLFEPIDRRGGAVMDIVGDAMLAVWEAPVADAATRRAACEAALAIQQSMAEDASATAPAWPTRIGLHCGEMRIGTVGAAPHFEFRAVGDAVNTAARLEGLNKLLGTRVLASAAVVQDVPGLVLRPVGSFLLAGKQAPIDVVEVLAAQDAPHADQADLLARFAQALAHYRAGQVAQAEAAFSALLDRHPADGPARYYRGQCRLLDDPAHHDPRLPIRVASK